MFVLLEGVMIFLFLLAIRKYSATILPLHSLKLIAQFFRKYLWMQKFDVVANIDRWFHHTYYAIREY